MYVYTIPSRLLGTCSEILSPWIQGPYSQGQAPFLNRNTFLFCVSVSQALSLSADGVHLCTANVNHLA